MSRADEAVAVRRFPGAPITYDNVAYYDALLRRELLVNRCEECGRWHVPPQPVCPACWSARLLPTPVSGMGTVYMFTDLDGPSGTKRMVTVELIEQVGLRFTAELIDATGSGRVIGLAVRVGWRESEGVPVPVFVPDQGDDSG